MKFRTMSFLGASALAISMVQVSYAQYTTEVIKSGLKSPRGITVTGSGAWRYVYYTEVPTPGVGGALGGNTVNALRLSTGDVKVLATGEPEPTNLALSPTGQLYWTCRSAGVILTRPPGGNPTLVLGGLSRPTGIALAPDGSIFFTQVPTPGVNGANGGTNTVDRLATGMVTTLAIGEPEPTDITVAPNGDAYWTCRSAGVILERDHSTGAISLFLGGLNKPMGIAVDKTGSNLYFTEVPTPGVPGRLGGGNFVWRVDLASKKREIVHFGDPEPSDVAVDSQGNVYWTCTSAGVIVRAMLAVPGP